MTGFRWIAVSGGRHYRDYTHVDRVLREERPDVIVQGECPTASQGADGLAKRWASENGVPYLGAYALWKSQGKGAGPIRNAWMLDNLPIWKLVAFPGGRGTNDAVEAAESRDILVRDERILSTPSNRSGEKR